MTAQYGYTSINQLPDVPEGHERTFLHTAGELTFGYEDVPKADHEPPNIMANMGKKLTEEQAEEARGAWKRIYNEALETWLTACEEVLDIPKILILNQAGEMASKIPLHFGNDGEWIKELYLKGFLEFDIDQNLYRMRNPSGQLVWIRGDGEIVDVQYTS